ncbi:D-aspartate oxidase [Dermatophagoides farinae]
MERILVESIRFFNQLIQDPQSNQFGVSRLTIFELFSNKNEACLPIASNELPVIRTLESNEIQRLFPTIGQRYQYGNLVETFIAEPSLFLPYLMDKFRAQNGKMITTRVENLLSLKTEYDLIINCTGINARKLNDVNDNNQLRSARGQVMRVKAPWIRHGILADQWYILPQNDCIVLGGTKDLDNYSLEPDPNIAEQIWKNCCNLMPTLAGAKKIGDYVGLRPYRSSLRIELDDNHDDHIIIHNYGHGGSGVTLCWGSAIEVINIIKKKILF